MRRHSRTVLKLVRRRELLRYVWGKHRDLTLASESQHATAQMDVRKEKLIPTVRIMSSYLLQGGEFNRFQEIVILKWGCRQAVNGCMHITHIHIHYTGFLT